MKVTVKEPFTGSNYYTAKPTLDGWPAYAAYGKDRSEILIKLNELADVLEEKIVQNAGWYEVQPAKEAKGKMTRCTVICDAYLVDRKNRFDREGELLENGKNCSCFVANSLFEVSPEGITYAPAWAVLKGLEETRKRAQFKYQKFYREPVDSPCWPAHLRKAWIDSHMEQAE